MLFSSTLFLSSIKYCHSLHRFIISCLVVISHELLISQLLIITTVVDRSHIFTYVGDLTLDLLAIRGSDGELSVGTHLDALVLSCVQNLQDILR